MKPCKICTHPKTYHNKGIYCIDVCIACWDDKKKLHKFELDNLALLERKFEVKQRNNYHKKLNFCQLCNQVKKSPFGICKECSENIISKKELI